MRSIHLDKETHDCEYSSLGWSEFFQVNRGDCGGKKLLLHWRATTHACCPPGGYTPGHAVNILLFLAE